jgi:hypothetical protein
VTSGAGLPQEALASTLNDGHRFEEIIRTKLTRLLFPSSIVLSRQFTAASFLPAIFNRKYPIRNRQ